MLITNPNNNREVVSRYAAIGNLGAVTPKFVLCPPIQQTTTLSAISLHYDMHSNMKSCPPKKQVFCYPQIALPLPKKFRLGTLLELSIALQKLLDNCYPNGNQVIRSETLTYVNNTKLNCNLIHLNYSNYSYFIEILV